ncbi:MAG: hypothetical protein ACI4XJ_10180 [Eubacteriales bacterium]
MNIIHEKDADWIRIENENDIEDFLGQCNYFHDSCIEEMYYRSGAFVDKNLNMRAVNLTNELTVRFNSQNKKLPAV